VRGEKKRLSFHDHEKKPAITNQILWAQMYAGEEDEKYRRPFRPRLGKRGGGGKELSPYARKS